MNIIEINNWDYVCGDGCCYDSGVELILNGERITQYFLNSDNGAAEALKDLLVRLGVNAQVLNNGQEVQVSDTTEGDSST
jgi:hypothetical protein